MATTLFVVTSFTDYKWVTILLGAIMVCIIVLSLFLEEIPLDVYFSDWIVIAFWVAFATTFIFGIIFLMRMELWWIGLIAVVGIVAVIVISLIAMLIFNTFPLLPGANITIVAIASFMSVGSTGIAIGKGVSDKKNGICIPFFENCSRYECDDLGKCRKRSITRD